VVASRPETEWDATQRGWMLALAEHRSGRCKGCGHKLDETTGRKGARQRWQIRKARCWACHDLEGVRLQHLKNDKPDDRPGARLMWVEKAG
jgi:hypothetical protein